MWNKAWPLFSLSPFQAVYPNVMQTCSLLQTSQHGLWSVNSRRIRNNWQANKQWGICQCYANLNWAWFLHRSIFMYQRVKKQLYLNFFAALWFSQICAPFWELPVIIEIASQSTLIASCFGILWWVGASFYDPYPHSVLYILQVSFSRYLSSKISDKPWKIAFHFLTSKMELSGH